MTSDAKRTNQSLQLYITPADECPYLPNKQSRTVFLNPEVQTNDALYTWLIDLGFRRSGEHVYRPECEDCNSCISVRIKAKEFKPNKQQRRCSKKGKRFIVKSSPASFDQDHYQLFEQYINTRHKDGDMYPTSKAKYKDFILSEFLNTQFLDFIDPLTGKLIACCVFDQLKSGLSAVYTYFDNDFNKYSLGRLAILTLIERCKSLNLDFVYLGYWIKDCQKMSYKGEYRPIQCFINDQWIGLN